MRSSVKIIAAISVGLPLLLIPPAIAETYRLPIEGGTTILKIFLDNGRAKLLERDNDTAVYEVEMDPGECIADMALAFSNNAPGLRTRYDVCSEKGFELTMRRVSR